MCWRPERIEGCLAIHFDLQLDDNDDDDDEEERQTLVVGFQREC